MTKIVDATSATNEIAALEYVQRRKRYLATDIQTQRRLDRARSVKIEQEALAELVLHKVRELMEPFFDPQLNGGLPVDELMLQALKFSAGSLALMPLDEPAALKVRRLGRTMEVKPIPF